MDLEMIMQTSTKPQCNAMKLEKASSTLGIIRTLISSVKDIILSLYKASVRPYEVRVLHPGMEPISET